MTVKYGAGRRLQGLRGVKNVCVGRIFLSYVACFVAAQHELNPLQPRTPPPKSMGFLCSFPPSGLTGDLCVPCHFPFSLLFFFFLWPLDLFRIL